MRAGEPLCAGAATGGGGVYALATGGGGGVSTCVMNQDSVFSNNAFSSGFSQTRKTKEARGQSPGLLIHKFELWVALSATQRSNLLLDLDLDVDACREVETLKRIDRLWRRLDDVKKTLVDTHLEVLA